MFRNSQSFVSVFSVSLALVGAALLTLAAPARADEYAVTTLANDGVGSLRQAILDANTHSGADVIRFSDGLVGQINLTSGQLVISESVTIEGPGADLVAVDAGQLSRVLLIQADSVTIRGLTLRNGRCAVGENGGGILAISHVSLTLEDCAITGNTAPQDSRHIQSGGGIAIDGTLVARRCLFADNAAEAGVGGAVYFNSSPPSTLENCTFARNRAGVGGAIHLDQNTKLKMESCTVTANTASLEGGAVFDIGYASATLHNCIIAGNVSAKVPDVSATVISQGYNLIGDTTDSDGWVATDLLNMDPMLDVLADNGGPTMTCALLPGSPAHDAADPMTFPATDQRGIARPQGNRADIGAFEVVNHPPVLTVPASVSGVVGSLLTFQASATDPDDDSLTFSLVSAPAGATIDPSTGVVSWTPSAGGTYSFQIEVTDPYGASDTGTTTVNVSALAIQNVTLSRDSEGTVTVKFFLSNLIPVNADNVTLTVATLGGVNTSSPLPQHNFTIKPGASKQGTLQFKGVPSGMATLVIQGASSLGAFFSTQTVTVP